jgi:hypothetical protein
LCARYHEIPTPTPNTSGYGDAFVPHKDGEKASEDLRDEI